ncbi:MAG: hypothetical protein A2268_15860 [Candidatus Raymondbacteria bacterium RifOxyA12_full_50_37]|nr:MAG: hypothetical protein A2268_15860 [Candidatus Raymondbacteria bacterium RifOxyA12_full_50_37]OGJ89226.1 MAG: hypothetical protein A2248_18755 [Candidatus Raymondbacteria bacterium RIFOXYA2_FULL_49_16]OGJ97392.1 MAG: hypothetical protein A2453_03675 [Candidatus Raymondbacteria bacterium RIFOXYC2_FULL_50_21]OGK01946.1 MAG: hypothetical protein A2350_17620 [Candidatus Raymondbacteria bacterium RifOxyB12_full_50_8]OGP42601.1 MAG: hypothetical protein A2324_06460 [Candidatus Raymondbacteria b
MCGCILPRLSSGPASGLSMPSPMAEGESDSQFCARARDHCRQVQEYALALERALLYAESHPGLFTEEEGTVLPPEAKDSIRMAWQALLPYFYGLEQARALYSSFWKINYLAHKEANLEAFCVTYTAFLAMQVHGSRFIHLINGKKQIEICLNESDRDLFPDSYDRLKYNTLNIVTFSQIQEGRGHFDTWCAPYLKEQDDSLHAWVYDRVRFWSDSALSQARGLNFALTVKNGDDLTAKQHLALWFPLQKQLAAWMGRTTYGAGRRAPLITPQQIDSLQNILEPGDIIFERSNWVLSNIGLPGFWPHVELYVGTPGDLDAYFNANDECLSLLRDLNNGEQLSPTAHVQKHFPEAYAALTASRSEGPVNIIEARSNGIIFSPAQEACHADYVAALRPRLSKKERLVALFAAFSYFGRPYDFDFDFASDATLVCTELVYKAYQRREGVSRGLSFPLTEILGRLTLPPNNMVALFDREYGMPDCQLEFAAFFDGVETKGLAMFRDADAFRKSYLRPKWDFLQD